jgi:hypothetical protein
MARARQYLFTYDDFRIVDTVANLGAGKTVTAYWSESPKPSGTAIAR